MIRIRGVSKSFADTTVLDGLDLDIPRQNVVTVIGPSGSGKSTLLRILDFLEHADSGTVDFGDGLVGFDHYQICRHSQGAFENRVRV